MINASGVEREPTEVLALSALMIVAGAVYILVKVIKVAAAEANTE